MQGALFIVMSLFILSNSSCSQANHAGIIEKGVRIDSIFVDKSERKLIVFSSQKKIKEYKIGLGNTPIGKKQFEGDGKTPEGLYIIDAKSAASKFHKNLNISYPNAEDLKFAKTHGKSAGGEIKIHGLPNDYNIKTYVISDWTLGCIALNNDEIDEVFEHIQLGCPVLIVP